MSLLLYKRRGFYFVNVVRPICCGADVHKDIIVATIAKTKIQELPSIFKDNLILKTTVLTNLKIG